MLSITLSTLLILAIALPAFFIFGHHRFKNYRNARLQSARAVQGIKNFSQSHAVVSLTWMSLPPSNMRR